MIKLLQGIIILLVFTNCNSEAKKRNFTIDYLKSNKWCATKNGDQMCCEFSGNEMKSTKNGKTEAFINFVFEQKSDSLIAIKYAEIKDFAYFRMKSLDILSFYHNESGGDETEEVFELVRVKQTPPKKK
tara:strand:+ start:670 stop:1056 length:387 start_codon:yes stop_codon:yes gene_type:complete